MLQLNDDCLYYMFCRISLKEQITMAYVCKRFRNIISGVVWHRKFRQICSTLCSDIEALNIDEFQQLFELIADRLETLVITDTAYVAFSTYLGRHMWRPQLEYYLSLEYPSLREFECHDKRLHDGDIRLLADKCPQLRSLRVNSSHVTGVHIKDMSNLEELRAPNSSLTLENLNDIFHNLKISLLNVPEAGINFQFLSNFKNFKYFRTLRITKPVSYPIPMQYDWRQFLEDNGNAIKILHLGSVPPRVQILPCIRQNMHLQVFRNVTKMYLNGTSTVDLWEGVSPITMPILNELHLVEVPISVVGMLLDRAPKLENLYLHDVPDIEPFLSNMIAFNEMHPLKQVLTVHLVQYKEFDIDYESIHKEMRDTDMIKYKLIHKDTPYLEYFVEFGF